MNHPSNWLDAQSSCAIWGGDLTSITTQRENNYLNTLITSSVGNCWIGLNDRDVEGMYTWIDGTTVSYTKGMEPTNATVDYTKGMEPTNATFNYANRTTPTNATFNYANGTTPATTVYTTRMTPANATVSYTSWTNTPTVVNSNCVKIKNAGNGMWESVSCDATLSAFLCKRDSSITTAIGLFLLLKNHISRIFISL